MKRDRIVTGKVARMTDFGAFVELEEGIDAILQYPRSPSIM